jgi:hypothetical protein
MTKPLRRVAAVSLVLALAVVTVPVNAQFVVYDPTNYANAVLRYGQLVQQLAQLKGGEAVETLNLTPDGSWRFTLPSLDTPVRLRYADRGELLSLRTDTVLLEPEIRQVTLIARARTPFVRNRGPLKEVVLGHVRPLWWRAAVRRKYYTNTGGKSGVLTGVPCYKV